MQWSFHQKFIYITLNDGSEVQLGLFTNGYLYYNYCHVFLKWIIKFLMNFGKDLTKYADNFFQ